MRPKLNPLMRLTSWVLRPLRDEHVSALEDELAIAQSAAQRALGERDFARQSHQATLADVDRLGATVARQGEELAAIDVALAAVRRRKQQAEGGEPS